MVILLLGLSFSLAHLIAKTARQKGRSYAAFFWLSILVSPVIMGIIVATMAPITPNSNSPH